MNRFLIADLHLYHKKIVEFTEDDGTKCRPWTSVEEMNEALVNNCNKVVGPNDRLYILGDAVFGKKNAHILGRLNCKKVLVKGNHDNFDIQTYAAYFEDIRAVCALDRYVLTHVPVHTQCLDRWVGNIHGHLHNHVVLGAHDRPDPRYLCVSAEQVNYTPIAFEEVDKIFKDRGI